MTTSTSQADFGSLSLPTHPLVRQLWQIIENKRLAGQPTTPELLGLFWHEVAALGTPLLHGVDGMTRATFLYREEIEHMVAPDWAYQRIYASFDTTGIKLSRLPRSNVWWAEVDLPDDFTGMYYFEIWNREGLICEDIHEPWAMSFPDLYNSWDTNKADSAYPRNIATTKPAMKMAPEGTVSELQVSAEHLEVPERVWRSRDGSRREPDPETFPVWTYRPHSRHVLAADRRLPLAVLMAGQFHESMNLSGHLDLAIETGLLPPIVVTSPGYFREGYKAWGWRNGYGPGHYAEFIDQTLVPEVSRCLGTEERVHLVGWSWTSQRTVETALRVPDRVASLTFVAPRFAEGWPGSHSYVDFTETNVMALAQRLPNTPIAVGIPPVRGASPFAWASDETDRFVMLATIAGLDLRTFNVSDPNIVAQGEAIPCGISVTMGWS